LLPIHADTFINSLGEVEDVGSDFAREVEGAQTGMPATALVGIDEQRVFVSREARL
jgi:hypothetical protein